MQELFPGTQVKSSHLFRVIRDADLEFDQEEADDLLETVDRSLKQLRHGALSLLQVRSGHAAADSRDLVENEITDDAVVLRTADRMGFGDWLQLHALHRPELKFAPYTPHTIWRTDIDPEEIFDQIKFEDVLVHHPYVILTPLGVPPRGGERSACRRAQDDAVSHRAQLAAHSAAHRGGEAGKQVAVLVELKR